MGACGTPRSRAGVGGGKSGEGGAVRRPAATRGGDPRVRVRGSLPDPGAHGQGEGAGGGERPRGGICGARKRAGPARPLRRLRRPAAEVFGLRRRGAAQGRGGACRQRAGMGARGRRRGARARAPWRQAREIYRQRHGQPLEAWSALSVALAAKVRLHRATLGSCGLGRGTEAAAAAAPPPLRELGARTSPRPLACFHSTKLRPLGRWAAATSWALG